MGLLTSYNRMKDVTRFLIKFRIIQLLRITKQIEVKFGITQVSFIMKTLYD